MFYLKLFIGGVGETLTVCTKKPAELFELMLKAFQKGSLVSCAINSKRGEVKNSSKLFPASLTITL